MADQPVRAGLLLRACMEILREAQMPLPGRDVLTEVAARHTLTDYELEVNRGRQPRWETHLRYQTGDAATIGWLSKLEGKWSLTEAGEAALDAFPGDTLFSEVRRRLNETLLLRKQALNQLSGDEQEIARALALVVPGFWTALDDLAELVGTDPTTIAHFLAQVGPTGAYRVLNADGSELPQGMLNVNFRGTDILARLANEGVELTQNRRASQDQRITAADLRDRLAEIAPDNTSSTKRAWLIRGSSVEGRDLVPVWLHMGSASLAAAELRPVTPPIARAALKAAVEEDYKHKSYSVREAKFAEFDAFCNRMRPGDLVLTTTQGKAYLGRITDDAEYVESSDRRSNLRRAVQWLNETQPVAFTKLPDPLPAKLHSQSDVVELTEDIATIEALLRDMGVEVIEPAPAPQRELAFPEIPQELADEVLIDRSWLQRQADLLWRRRQMIFYGPPGTGKTFLARKIAQRLAEPSAVTLVQFHPSYTYEDFFEGFRPVQRDDGQLAFTLHWGPFRALVDDARAHEADPYILIIDEINRANLAKVFGELYFLLEYRDADIKLMYSDEPNFTLPKNIFIIGTMNTTDRSIALVDAAMRRRFAFVELHPAEQPTSEILRAWLDARKAEGAVRYHADAADLLDELNKAIEERDLAVGPSYLMHPDIYQREDGLDEVWQTAILPLLEEQHYGEPREVLDRYRLDTLRKRLNAGRDDGFS